MKSFVFSTALAAAAHLNSTPQTKGAPKSKSSTEGLRAKVRKVREAQRKSSRSGLSGLLVRSAK
ncbi:MAG: hypothetical protein DI585_00405 [Pseudomonas fluorescens]|nr:MAG: hypothetical protein DI585_00405 [Pseudomonas fluorescens]